eukprot:CCRYP_019398-RD/>CCRYP_019398-RD protein AED:0.41 eAED:0.47 QI:275/0/0.5/1/0/0/2/0/271
MILYAVIARSKDGTILVESTVAGVESTNFPQITVEVLQRVVATSDWNSALGTIESSSKVELLPDEAKRTFVQRHDEGFLGGLLSGVAAQWGCLNGDVEAGSIGEDCLDYYFHMGRGRGIICLCISDDSDARYHAVNFNFLDDAQSKFTSSYSPSKIAKAKAYEMDKQFRRELGKIVHYYNENRNKFARHDKVDILLDKVDDLREVLGRNISMVLERERKLDDLIEQSENMMMDTQCLSLYEPIHFALHGWHVLRFSEEGVLCSKSKRDVII